jgi:hypothetical protein
VNGPDDYARAGEDSLAGLISLLTDVDEFLRSPGTRAALADFYRDRRGSAFPGQDASLLIDSAGFTLYSLVLRAAAASPDATGS